LYLDRENKEESRGKDSTLPVRIVVYNRTFDMFNYYNSMATAKLKNLSSEPKTGFLLWTTFICGICLMTVEMTASRILAPYFGTSLFVWANIIGVVLLALSLGYYWGGKFADRSPTANKLYYLIFAAAVWTASMPWFSTSILRATLTFPSTAVFGLSLLAAILIYFVPCTIFGMISPYILKLLSKNQKNLGSEAGRLSAVSTIGCLLGTFLPVLVGLPLIGTLRTILICAAILFFTASLGLKRKSLQLFTIITLIMIWFAPVFVSSANTIYSGESSYSFVRVYERFGNRFLQIDDPRAVHSIKMADSTITHNYWDYAIAVPAQIPTKSTLILGVAGGNISNLFNQYFPDMKITGIEIDPLVVEVGKQFFNTTQNPNTKIITEEARNYLAHTSEKYDLIVLDTYHNLNLPIHLSTTEFFSLIRDHLTSNGTVAINVAHNAPQSALDDYLLATMAPHYQYLYSIDTNGGYNSLLIGRNQPWPEKLTNEQNQLISTSPELYHVWQKLPPKAITQTDPSKIQTDDRNILEWLSSSESIR
jgi:spermidine synthase